MNTTALIKKLADALERTQHNFCLAVQQKPVRDMAETLAEGDEALTEARAWLATGGWQTIESAPKDGTQVLLYGPFQWGDYAECQITGHGVGYWNIEEWLEDDDPNKGRWEHISTNPYIDYAQPIAWQPLPAPPTTQTEEE